MRSLLFVAFGTIIGLTGQPVAAEEPKAADPAPGKLI